jgi:hypothetical protein
MEWPGCCPAIRVQQTPTELVREPGDTPDHKAVLQIFVNPEISGIGLFDAFRLFCRVDWSARSLSGGAESDCPGKSQ